MHSEVTRMFDLTGKVALITGGAVHLGYDAACVLAGAGCHLAITSRDLVRAQMSAEALHSKYGIDVLPLQLDHTRQDQVMEAIESAHAWKRRIDIMVNNAGGGSNTGSCLLFERSPEDMARMVEVNLTGVLYCCRAVSRIMADQKHGKIINIASIAGLCGRDRRIYERNHMVGQPVDYAAAKAGVIGLTLDLAGFLSPMGVNVNAISPGGFNRGLPEGFVRDYSDRTPLGRMGRDGVDLNGAILFLASPASDYITGQNLVVDGGFTLWH